MSDSVPYFPSKFGYYLKKLSGFKRETVKLYPLNRTTFKSGGDSISFDLPSGIIDPSTFAIHWLATGANITTPANTSAFPDNVESLINRYSISVGGTLANAPCMNSNLLANALLGLQCGTDIRDSSRSVLSNGTSATVATNPTKHMWLNQFMGLLNVNHYLDTQLLNGIRIELITESGNVMSAQTNADICTFELSDVYAICDVILLDGEAKAIYESAMASKMRSGGIVIPFKHWNCINEQVASSSGSVKISVASGCVNKIVAIPQATNARTATQTQGTSAEGNRSKFFYQTKGSIKDWSVMFGGRQSISITADEMSYLVAQQALGLQKDVSTGSLVSSANWTTSRFSIVQSLEYVGDGVDRAVLGYDSRLAPNGYLNLNSDGGGTNVMVNVFIETTPILRLLAPGIVSIEN